MNRMVSELLMLTRLQNGLSTLEMRPLDLEELLSGLVLAMQPQAVAAGVDLRFVRSGPDTCVLADSDRLKQAFGNLLDNALKYTAPGGSVVLEVVGGTPRAEVIVRDTGKGIPQDDLDRVAERFYQVDKSRSAIDGKSLGLGLAIAREVLRAHHGDMRVESREGIGTSVYVSLPSAPVQPPPLKRGGRLRLPAQSERVAGTTQETDVKA